MTQFTVSFWESTTSPVPLATIPVKAKMPLGAMVFAMQAAAISHAEYVGITWDDQQTAFYHVELDGKNITFDRAVPEKEVVNRLKLRPILR